MCCYGGATFHFPETVRNRGQGSERGQSGPGLGKGRTQKSINCQVQLVAQLVKNPPAMWETWVQSLGQEDPLEEGMGTHSSILAWKIPQTEEPGRLRSMGLQPATTRQLSTEPPEHPGSCTETAGVRRSPGAELRVAWQDLCPLRDQQRPLFTSSIWYLTSRGQPPAPSQP